MLAGGDEGDISEIHALKLGSTNTAEYSEVTVFDKFQGRITAVAVQD